MSKTPATPVEKWFADYAAAQDAKRMPSPASSRAKSKQAEFNLPDEDRIFPTVRLEPCPTCGFKCGLYRRTRKINGVWVLRYRVCCYNQNCATYNQTAEAPTSQEAVRVWQLSAKLSQL